MSTGAPPMGGVSRRTVVIATAVVVAASAVATLWQFGARREGAAPPPVSSATPAPITTASPTPAPPSTVLASTHMVSAQVGWGRSRAGGVLHTTDGAAHWTTVSPPSTPGGIAATAFIDADHAVVFSIVRGSTAVDLGSAVAYRTADGGRTWKQGATVGGVGLVVAMSFPDATHGWVLDHLQGTVNLENVSVLRTVDGGAHFTEVSRSSVDASPGTLPSGCNKSGISFDGTQLGWVTATCSGAAPFLYVTRDGGGTWRRDPLADPAGREITTCSCTVDPPQFTSPLHAFLPLFDAQPAAGALTTMTLYVSDDAGTHWTPHPPVTVPVPYGVGAIDGMNLYLVGSQTPWELWRTADGGRTWYQASNDPRLTGRFLDFPTPTVGFASPLDPSADLLGGPLLRSDDGGRSWHAMPTQVIPRG